MKQSFKDILKNANDVVESNKDYYDKIQNNWNKTIINRKEREEEAIKKHNAEKSRDILDFI